jgi:hypothetical protein
VWRSAKVPSLVRRFLANGENARSCYSASPMASAGD